MSRKVITLASSFVLASCGPAPTIVHDTVHTVPTPVAQPCVTERPARVTPLRDTFTQADWLTKTLQQKAAIVAAQGLHHQSYAQLLDVATAACPEVIQ